MPSKASTPGHDQAISKQRLLKPGLKDSKMPAHPAPLSAPGRLTPDSLTSAQVLQLQRAIGNQAVGQLLARANPIQANPIQANPIQMKPDDEEDIQLKPDPAQASVLQMKAGVESFEVKWKKNADAGPTVAKLRLDYKAKFKKDADHNPAHAEFRQNIDRKFRVTAGTHKGLVLDNTPMHDDNYSRSDDSEGRTIDDVNFTSNDNPGASGLSADDVIDYTFTAEQLIIDTSDSNKVIAKRGPHTGTIKGRDPREYDKALPFTAKAS